MLILKNPSLENCTPYWVNENEPYKDITSLNTYTRSFAVKDFFESFLDNINEPKEISLRGHRFIVYQGVVINYFSKDIFAVFTKENILYLNNSNSYPNTWITPIRKSIKSKGLNPNKVIKSLPTNELNDLFKFTFTVEFSDSNPEVQKEIMQKVQRELSEIYPIISTTNE